MGMGALSEYVCVSYVSLVNVAQKGGQISWN